MNCVLNRSVYLKSSASLNSHIIFSMNYSTFKIIACISSCAAVYYIGLSSVIHACNSVVEKTQPLVVVSAILTAKSAEKGGVVWSGPVIKSSLGISVNRHTRNDTGTTCIYRNPGLC